MKPGCSGRIRVRRYWWPAVATFLLGGCHRGQSALHPIGIQSERIHNLWRLYFWTSVTVYVVVIGLILLALWLRRSSQPLAEAANASPSAPHERRLSLAVIAGVVFTTLVLFVLLTCEFLTERALHRLATEKPDLQIQITARQWWWEVQYLDPTPSKIVTTANELHLPVGRTVEVLLKSSDVIHSFWVPNLHGKVDAIPGRVTRQFLRADTEGNYWGQCAEFCGDQHSHMRLAVVTHASQDFDQWLDSQRQPAKQPINEQQRAGQQVFLGSSCIMCHTIQGTPARGRIGPDLTHFASRPVLGAGVLPNVRGNLAGWILDPQRIKPGVRMPVHALPADQLHPLLDYLQNLK